MNCDKKGKNINSRILESTEINPISMALQQNPVNPFMHIIYIFNNETASCSNYSRF